MVAHFAIHHHTDSPAFYDIIIEREQVLSVFRIDHLDILDFLDGNEVIGQEIDAGVAGISLEVPAARGKGAARLFDAGTCAIELWSPPVYIVQVASRELVGTLHILNVADGCSLRYVRSRVRRSAPPAG